MELTETQKRLEKGHQFILGISFYSRQKYTATHKTPNNKCVAYTGQCWVYPSTWNGDSYTICKETRFTKI